MKHRIAILSDIHGIPRLLRQLLRIHKSWVQQNIG